MIFHRMTLLICLLNKSRVGRSFRTDDKEGRFYIVALKK